MRVERKLKSDTRFCPYCEETLEGALSAYCMQCKVTTFYCPDCQKPVPPGKKTCPSCGARIKG